MTKTSDALELADETLAQLELGTGRLTPLVLRCLRLARMVGSIDAEGWFRAELRGYREDIVDETKWELYASWSGRQASKNAEGNQRYWIAPIEVIESDLEIAEHDLNSLQLTPIAVSEQGGEQKGYSFLPTTTEKVMNAVLLKRSERARKVSQWRHVVGCLRGAMQEWLSRVVIQLRYGAVVDTAFGRAKARFDAVLQQHAPDVARRLAAAYQRADSEDPEEWSQALTSCRRALKALADILYPPTDETPGGHSLTDSDYRNRLIQFVAEHLDSKSQKEFIDSEIDTVVKRVEALDSLASKGVHSDVTERDLDMCIVSTYLLAGELLALLPEQEMASTPPRPEVEEQSAPPQPGPVKKKRRRSVRSKKGKDS